MSLHHLAGHLAAQGRGPDTTLVHMTPGEVNGLQALAKAAGGSLTINPKTGLAEAGFLSSILPLVAGIGLNMLIPGLGPLATGAIVGGGTALASGNIEKGLLAGLGAYGGAGLGEGLTSLGASSVAPAELAAANTAADPIASLASSADTAAASNALNATQAPQGIEALKAGTQNFFNNPKSLINTMGSSEAIKSAGAAAAPALSEAMTPKLPELPKSRPGYIRPYKFDPVTGQYTEGTPILESEFGGRSLGMAEGGEAKVPQKNDSQKAFDYLMGQGNYPLTSNAYRMESGRIMPVNAPSAPPMAAGVSQKNIGPEGETLPSYVFDPRTQSFTNTIPSSEQKSSEDGIFNTSLNPFTGRPFSMAQGGLAGLSSSMNSFAAGGQLLRGPGDGVSDSIPAVIGHNQPARLADGEFVVPARIVSELGNGSTEAGARKLYAMMDRVQKARRNTTGKTKIATNSRADKHLPA